MACTNAGFMADDTRTSDGVAKICAADPNNCLQGILKIDKHEFDVTFDGNFLTWTKKNTPTKNKVSIDEILNASKSLTEKTFGVTVCYVKNLKNRILKRETIQFLCGAEEASRWSDTIQLALRQLKKRPKRLLVIINPESGDKIGKKIYDTLVKGIFKQANVETDLMVTKRAHHCEEIISTYDLSSINGIVLFGGDGIYHETVNGLQRRLATEAGLDVNNPGTSLPTITIPIGMIPTGSWNYIASASYGCNDVETAVLSIIIGKTVTNDILAVHCKDELVGYAGVLVGYGYLGDVIYASQTNRWTGSFRYTMAVLSTSLVKKPRQMDLKVECLLPCDDTSKEINGNDVSTSNKPGTTDGGTVSGHKQLTKSRSSDSETNDTTDSDKMFDNKQTTDSGISSSSTTCTIDSVKEADHEQSTESQLSYSETEEIRRSIHGVYTGAVFLVGNTWCHGNTNNIDNSARMVMSKPCGTLQHFRFLRKIAERQTQALEIDPSDDLAIKEVQLTLITPSEPDTENGMKERFIDLDGELHTLKEPECHIVYHSKTLRLFTSG